MIEGQTSRGPNFEGGISKGGISRASELYLADEVCVIPYVASKAEAA